MSIKRGALLLLTGLLVMQTVFAQHGHDHEHHEHGQAARLLIADSDEPVLHVIDAATGEIRGTFTVPAGAHSLVATASGQYAVVTHPDANRVSIIHSGQSYEDHGDHGHLIQGTPFVLATMNLGQQPTHAWLEDDRVMVLLAGESSIAVLDEYLFGLSLDFTYVDGVETAVDQLDSGRFALTSGGSLQLLAAGDGAAASIRLFTAELPRGASLAVHGDHVFVTDPAAGQLHVVHVHDDELELETTHQLGGSPAGVTVLMLQGDLKEQH